jgi:hypothetical protein
MYLEKKRALGRQIGPTVHGGPRGSSCEQQASPSHGPRASARRTLLKSPRLNQFSREASAYYCTRDARCSKHPGNKPSSQRGSPRRAPAQRHRSGRHSAAARGHLRPALVQLWARPPYTIHTTTIWSGRERGGALGFAIAAGGGSWRWRSRSGYPTT